MEIIKEEDKGAVVLFPRTFQLRNRLGQSARPVTWPGGVPAGG